MQEKVTNYELSKELREHEFDGKSHCGWWFDGRIGCFKEGLQYRCGYTTVSALEPTRESTVIAHHLEEISNIKAYLCWDLLMWLREQGKINETAANFIGYLKLYGDSFDYTDHISDSVTEAPSPQNALAKAVIEILKEKKEGK